MSNLVNLLKADFYRLVRSKTFWICSALGVGLAVVGVITTQQIINALDKLAANTPEHLKDMMDALIEQLAGMKNSVGGGPIVGETLQMEFHTILLAIMVSIFVGSDFSHGTLKNLLTRGASRQNVFFSKLIVCCCANLFIVVLFMLASMTAGSAIWHFDPNNIVTAGNFLTMVFSQLFITIAYTAFFVAICMIIQNQGAGIAINMVCVLFAGSVLALSLLLSSVNLADYWLGGAMQKLASLTATPKEIWQSLIVGLAWGGTALGLGLLAFNKRDIK